MGDNLPALDFAGQRAVHLSVGMYSACAELANGELVCWGLNLAGVLGAERTGGLFPVTIGDEPGEMGAALTPTRLW